VPPTLPSGRNRPPPPAPPRRIALELIQAVLDRQVPFDEAWDDHIGLHRLPPRDRAFVRLLVLTLLRRLGQIDAVLAHLLNRPQRLKAEVRAILRLAAVQSLFLGTPAHAVVDSAVRLATSQRSRAFRPLVNAVLRRLTESGADLLATTDPAQNTPAWLRDSWTAAYGATTARRIAAAQLQEAPLDLSLKPNLADDDWAARLQAIRLPTGTLRRPAGGAVEDLPGYSEGAWWVQDAAAALAVRLFGDVRGRAVFDLCAAPGGKTAQLAAAGAQVTAVDHAPRRLERLRENMARLSLTADTIVADVESWRPDRPADAVLLDAPCSGTGTIRRHPDIQHLKTPHQVTALAALQARLLDHAATLVAPGGLLVYAVCSLQPEEAEQQVDRLLATERGFERMPLAAPEIAGLSDLITTDGDLRTLPGISLSEQGGVDGFFIARLRRRSRSA